MVELVTSWLQRSHDLAAVESISRGAPVPHINVLQRSHDLAAVERLFAVEEMPVMSNSLQRSHDLAAVERLPATPLAVAVIGFNGATTSRPWRAPRARRRPPKSEDALQRSHDLAAVERSPPSTTGGATCRFNGATTSRPWRALRVPGTTGSVLASTEPRPRGRGERAASGRDWGSPALQRSHDLAAVERSPPEPIPPPAGVASTEPRPRGRGESATEAESSMS